MWSRAAGISDEDLVAFNLRDDLVEVRSAPTSYGSIILGKIRIPAVRDEEGEGFIHVRCVPLSSWSRSAGADSRLCSIHDPPNRASSIICVLWSNGIDHGSRAPKTSSSTLSSPTKATATPTAARPPGVLSRTAIPRSSSSMNDLSCGRRGHSQAPRSAHECVYARRIPNEEELNL